MNRKLLSVLASLLAVTAVMIVPAMAQAATIEAKGTKLKSGAGVKLLGPIDEYYQGGIIHVYNCQLELTGKVTVNGAPVASIEIEAAKFFGEVKQEGPCPVAPYGGYYYEYITPIKLPWHLNLESVNSIFTLNDIVQEQSPGTASESWGGHAKFSTSAFEGVYNAGESQAWLTMPQSSNFVTYEGQEDWASTMTETASLKLTTAAGVNINVR